MQIFFMICTYKTCESLIKVHSKQCRLWWLLFDVGMLLSQRWNNAPNFPHRVCKGLYDVIWYSHSHSERFPWMKTGHLFRDKKRPQNLLRKVGFTKGFKHQHVGPELLRSQWCRWAEGITTHVPLMWRAQTPFEKVTVWHWTVTCSSQADFSWQLWLGLDFLKSAQRKIPVPNHGIGTRSGGSNCQNESATQIWFLLRCHQIPEKQKCKTKAT